MRGTASKIGVGSGATEKEQVLLHPLCTYPNLSQLFFQDEGKIVVTR